MPEDNTAELTDAREKHAAKQLKNALWRHRRFCDLAPANEHRQRTRLRAQLAAAELRMLRRTACGDAAGAALARGRADRLRARLAPLQTRFRSRLRAIFSAVTPAAIRSMQRELLAAPARVSDDDPRRLRRARTARDQIRRQRPGQRRGPPEPDPEAIAQEIAAALVAPLTRMFATLMAPVPDDWLSQRESPLPKRVHGRLARDLIERGDKRAARQSHLWLVRRSAIDEYLAGLPRGTVRRAGLDANDLLEADLIARGLL